MFAMRSLLAKAALFCFLVAGILVLGIVQNLFPAHRENGFSKQLQPLELLTIQSLMHVPECAADKHCRSACRMVCQESSEGIGTEDDHAASLVAFGCCFHAPLMEKQIVNGGGREMQLYQLSGRRTRSLLSTHLELHDKHSLQADFAELQKQEAALKKRLTQLPLRNALPFKLAGGKRIQSLMTDTFNAFGEGFTDGDYGWNGSAWTEFGDAGQRGWFSSNNKTKDSDAESDPWGTEWHYYAHKGKAHWNGRNCTGVGCPESSDGFQNFRKFASHLSAATAYGVGAKFDNRSRAVPAGGYDEPEFSDVRGLIDDAVPGLGVPETDSVNLHPDFSQSETRRLYLDRYGSSIDLGSQTWQWPDINLTGQISNSTPADNGWLWDESPHLSYRWCIRSLPVAECDRRLDAWHNQMEWRPRDCNGSIEEPISADAQATGVVGGSANHPLRPWLAPGEDAVRNGSNVSGCGFELVSRRLETEYGYDVARGLADATAVEAGLLSGQPSDDIIRHFLGSRLYRQYTEEEGIGSPSWDLSWGSNAGGAHRVLEQGVAAAKRRHAFESAYGKSEWKVCIAAHRKDPDFPKACTDGGGGGSSARADRFTAKPYQSRHKALTAPEEVLDGIEGAVRNLIGEDKQERVRAQTGVEALHPHANQFEYGPQAVPSGRVQGFGPAWWERMKGVRDVPQTVEGKAGEARDIERLPGVRVESWNGWPTLNRAMRPSIAVTPSQCCSTFMHYSDHE